MDMDMDMDVDPWTIEPMDQRIGPKLPGHVKWAQMCGRDHEKKP